MFDLNTRTLFHAVTVCLPVILETGVFIGGIVARGAGGGVALYAAAKAAAMYLKLLEVEVRETVCEVGMVYPMGAVDTPANRCDTPDTDPKNWIDPNEIGAAFLRMATRSSRGRTIEIQVFPLA